MFAQEVVLRFENQGETQRHLEQLKEDNEEEIKKLADQKTKLQVDYEQMKYSGEAKLSRSAAFSYKDQHFSTTPLVVEWKYMLRALRNFLKQIILIVVVVLCLLQWSAFAGGI